MQLKLGVLPKSLLADLFVHAFASVCGRRFGRLASNPRYFRMWQERGFHITPIHYYAPIPDTRTLSDDLWQKRSDLVGLAINENKQLELLSVFMSKYRNEYSSFPMNPTPIRHQYYLRNISFGSVDAEILYCMIRHFKPSRIVEIGSGHSTYLSAQAILENKKEDSNYESELIVVDPYPSELVKERFPGLSRVMIQRVEQVPLSEFTTLQKNDILFIDSSHVVKIGGDVQYEYLEILPRLTEGVVVHAHDIFLPAEYPKEWVLGQYRFWTEQYLLQAFLAFNASYEIIWAGSYMHLKYPDKLESAFSSYRQNQTWPGSFWIRRKRPN